MALTSARADPAKSPATRGYVDRSLDNLMQAIVDYYEPRILRLERHAVAELKPRHRVKAPTRQI